MWRIHDISHKTYRNISAVPILLFFAHFLCLTFIGLLWLQCVFGSEIWKTIMLTLFFILFLCSQYSFISICAEAHLRTLYSHKDPPDGNGKTFVINADDNVHGGSRIRQKRDLVSKPTTAPADGIITKVIVWLNDNYVLLNLLN